MAVDVKTMVGRSKLMYHFFPANKPCEETLTKDKYQCTQFHLIGFIFGFHINLNLSNESSMFFRSTPELVWFRYKVINIDLFVLLQLRKPKRPLMTLRFSMRFDANFIYFRVATISYWLNWKNAPERVRKNGRSSQINISWMRLVVDTLVGLLLPKSSFEFSSLYSF